VAVPNHSTPADRQIVSFPEWKEALAAEALASGDKFIFRQEIFAFLQHCKACHAGASIIIVQQYLPVAEAQGRTRAIRRGQTLQFALDDRQRQQRALGRNEVAATVIPEAIGMNSWPLVCICGPTSGGCSLQRWTSAVNGLPVWPPIDSDPV
jgi:hypothetical protein